MPRVFWRSGNVDLCSFFPASARCSREKLTAKQTCAYVPCRALKRWCFWKSKCWVYISLLWILVRRLLTLSTDELMTHFYRGRFACFVFVSDCFLDTLFQDLVVHPDKSGKNSCLLLIHGCFSAWTVDLGVLGWLQQVIASTEGQLLTLDLVLFFLCFHDQFHGWGKYL